LIQGIGCGTTKSLYSKVIPGGKDELKKRIWVVPLLDQAGVGEEKIAQITDNLLNLLDESGYFLARKGIEPSPSSQVVLTSESAFILGPALMKSADEAGIDVLVVGTLGGFETKSEEDGIWPFRETKRKVEISILINAVDVIDGGFLLSHLETVEKEFSTSPPDGQERKATLKETTLDEALSEILESQAEMITKELRTHPWRGRVTSAGAEGLLINGGRDIGLKIGSVFEVYGIEGSIQSLDGRTLPLLGDKVGEIEVVKVMDSSAEAVSLTGGPFAAGHVIQLRD